jgi:hypothetical protein
MAEQDLHGDSNNARKRLNGRLGQNMDTIKQYKLPKQRLVPKHTRPN